MTVGSFVSDGFAGDGGSGLITSRSGAFSSGARSAAILITSRFVAPAARSKT